MSFRVGRVYLIGAGPGDPGLLTLKGARALARADVVVYDHLVHPRVLAHARPGARRVFAGKRPGRVYRPGDRYGMSQAAIDRLMIREARRGRVVARVKGGDPFVFGRGGEEALALARARVPFEVVPGVTAAVAAPACAGIPVTHRGLSSAFLLVTGHEDPGPQRGALDWGWLARFEGTLGVYMGARNLPAIARALLARGKPPATPAAVIERGTWPRQRVVTAPLSEIAARAAAARIEPPAMIVLGPTVALRRAIAWFEKRPLAGRRVVVTRAAPDTGWERASTHDVGRSGPEGPSHTEPLAEAIEAAGGEVVEFPALALAPPRTWAPVDRAIRGLARGEGKGGRYSWVVFLSAHAVERFFGRLRALGRDARALADCRVAVIGRATAAALSTFGMRADVVAGNATSEGLARALRGRVGRGDRVLAPRTDIGRDTLPASLRKRGARVEEVTVYRTAPARRADAAAMRRALVEGGADVLTFASAQTVRNFVAAVGRAALRRILRRARVATIGPVTSAACRAAGLRVHAEARAPSIDALVDAAARACRRGGRARGDIP